MPSFCGSQKRGNPAPTSLSGWPIPENHPHKSAKTRYSFVVMHLDIAVGFGPGRWIFQWWPSVLALSVSQWRLYDKNNFESTKQLTRVTHEKSHQGCAGLDG
jgi:hypothetical protein